MNRVPVDKRYLAQSMVIILFLGPSSTNLAKATGVNKGQYTIIDVLVVGKWAQYALVLSSHPGAEVDSSSKGMDLNLITLDLRY